MEVILNIGLQSEAFGKIPAHWGTAAARLAGFKVTGAKLHQSDTEPTLVLTITDDKPGLDNRIDMLSSTLGQDCIATWYPGEQWGQLIGPRAAAWGSFNPEFFIMPDGTRLASTAAKAA